uniref:Fe2OG dioxygenase domain-containing protein n=1 Tax=Chlamydomonas leiostraca TaxID=1034604 RepID=A0A7S0WQJ9_9CHLO|mmetsp:Transcript_2372/g.5963  ORF Transcript_2372/g.5963 Transcript_2372/m.5963 type:complete len:305 (+) Transcript_2372:40-954(+)
MGSLGLDLLPTTCLLLVVCLVVAVSSVGSDEERLIGWKGEVEQQEEEGVYRHPETAGRDPWIETISWKPRAFIYHGFLSLEECDHLRGVALKRLERSMVVGDDGKDAVDDVRTSFSASINLFETETIYNIETRIANWTHLPIAHGEPMEVLRYKHAQKYDSHWDYFGGDSTNSSTGDRVATVLMYLSDVMDGAGGETSLPLAEAIDEQLQSTAGMSECASKMGIAVRPRKGDALLFWNSLPEALISDKRSLHASCPTFKGEKWTATKWIHTRAYLDSEVIKAAEGEAMRKRASRLAAEAQGSQQ